MKEVARSAALVTAVAASSFGIQWSMADAQSAQDYVKQAQELIKNNDADGAAAKLELAETELDGVDAAAKAPIATSIQSVKDSITSFKAAADVPKYKRKLERAMDEAEGAIGNQVTWPGAASAMKELLDDPAAKAAIPAEMETARKKFATFSKLSDKKIGAVVGAQVEEEMKSLEAKWEESKKPFSDPNAAPGDKSSAITDMSHAFDSAKRYIGMLPPDSDQAKAYTARIEKINAEFTQIALADKAKEVVTRLKESFESYKEEYEGWDKETAAGPTWDDYQHQQSEKTSAFNAPKSKGLISRADHFLKDLDSNDDFKEIAASPDAKAFAAGLKDTRDKAYAQMLKNVQPLVKEALAKGGEDLGKLKDDVRLALGEESPEGKAIQDSIQKRIDGAAQAASAQDDAQKEWYQKMSEAAKNAWPEISSKFAAEEGFDPNNAGAFKGKIIKITTDNLMGYRFKPGDFEFATTLSGVPVAGHFDSSIKPAIAAVEKKLGRSLGDNDDDGKWEVYAVVTGKTGRLLQKKQAEGSVKVDGQTVGTVTTDYADPVEAPIVTVIAVKCGPLAAGKGAGTLQLDGTVAR